MNSNTKRILFVDTDNQIIDFFENELVKLFVDIKILRASSYKEALNYILDKNNPIDISLVNYVIPNVKDGLLVDFILKKDIPVIVINNEHDLDRINKIVELDIIDYIVKTPNDKYKSSISNISRVLKNYDTNILLVDDSPMQLEMAKKMIKKLKLNVITAKDGKEGLDKLNNFEGKISLVLTDYHMPIMDGFELITHIRKQYNKDELSIIVLSANDSPEIPTRFIKLGANDFISKPYKQIEISTRINSNLEILELFQKTKDMANKDFLTGAFNRRYFYDSGNSIFFKAKRYEKNLVVAMFDIDKFKNINDTYGHDIGDIAICEMVNILNNNLRASDLMARFGGEEFCVLLEDITLEDTQKLFDKIRKIFKDNVIVVDKVEIKYTVSIGVCYGLYDSLDIMVKNADKGLYYCKENGRDQVAINK